MKKLRQLEDENRRLKQLVAEQTLDIQPGKPVQNTFIECSNSKFRDEYLKCALVSDVTGSATRDGSLATGIS